MKIEIDDEWIKKFKDYLEKDRYEKLDEDELPDEINRFLEQNLDLIF